MGNYEDIIHLPHHRSKKRSHMSMQDRAAQFSPFAALTGFDSAIEETGRLTDCRPELMDYGNTQLDQAIAQLTELISNKPWVCITYFVPDQRKTGGHRETITGHLLKIDTYQQSLILTDGTVIPMAEILHIESPEITDSIEE